MSHKHFLTNENLKLIWDVLTENEVFTNQSKEFLIKINYLLNQNIQPFYEEELGKNQHISLMELNKKFISLLLNHIQQTKITQLHHVNNEQPSKKELITSEDIQSHRQTQFEKDLSQKQKEFTNAMSLPVPPTPVFQDKKDEPLSELELEIKRTMAQRNYDIEIIQNNIHQVNADPSWLKPQETSVKKEKLIYQNTLTNSSNSHSSTSHSSTNPIKYIKIENKELDENILKKEIVDLNQTKKHISWADESINLEDDLFKKLKMIPKKTDDPNNLERRIENIEKKMGNIEQMLELILKKNENNLL